MKFGQFMDMFVELNSLYDHMNEQIQNYLKSECNVQFRKLNEQMSKYCVNKISELEHF